MRPLLQFGLSGRAISALYSSCQRRRLLLSAGFGRNFNRACTRKMASSPQHSTEELNRALKDLFPKLTPQLYKGQCGRLGVIGGSAEYTGAPYFAAISMLKTGADLAHVFCPPSASTVIKSYSPELIVHPVLNASDCTQIVDWLDRLHAVVLGPGLGREPSLLKTVTQLVAEIRKRNLPLVIDADGLFFVGQSIDSILGYSNAVLTPNVVEFSRLWSLTGSKNECSKDDIESGAAVSELATRLNHVTVVQKGRRDLISNGKELLICDREGSVRRCGGQGDLLSGSAATFLHFARLKSTVTDQGAEQSPALHRFGGTMLGAYAACCLTKDCSQRAFERFGRSTTTGDLINEIPNVLDSYGVLK